MKIQLSVLIAALALSACSGTSDAPPAAAPVTPAAAPAPAAPAAKTEAAKAADQPVAPPDAADKAEAPKDPAQAEMIKKAEALTQEQIHQSRDPAALGKLAQLYVDAGDPERFAWTLEQLTQLLPNSGNLKLQLAMAYAGLGLKSKTYDVLVRMVAVGYSYDIAKDPRFAKVNDTRVWEYITQTFATNGKPYGEGKVAFEIPKGDKLIESIAWDPKRKQFLAGSVREGKIYLVDNSGKLTDFISTDASNGLMGVYDLAVDAAHDKLYAIANGVPYFNGFNADLVGKAGLFEFTLSSGKFLHKYILPQDNGTHILSSIVAGSNGQVYVADGVNQQIFRLDGGALKLMVGNPVLNGIRGMALSGDGKTLYFADVGLGIFGLDLATMKPFSLGFSPDKLTLGGIDGLYWYDGTLVAIQNAMSPLRVMRLKLSADGRSVAAAMPLDAAQPAFGLPTVGTVSGDGLYFIANSQRSNYDSLGALTQADKLQPVRIFRSDLRYAWDQMAGAPPRPAPHYTPEELKKIINTPPRGIIPQPAQKPGDGTPKPADDKANYPKQH
jgi:hypothetical protein